VLGIAGMRLQRWKEKRKVKAQQMNNKNNTIKNKQEVDEESGGSQSTSAASTPAGQMFDFHQNSHLRQVYVLMNNINFYLMYCERHLETTDASLRHIHTYSTELKTFSIYLLRLSFICIIAVSPVLLLKSLDHSNEFVTHAHVYSWKYSLAFVTGEVPAGLLLCAWAVSCSAFIFIVIRTLKTYSSQFLSRQRSKSSIIDEGMRRYNKRKSDFLGRESFSDATRSFVRKSVPRGSAFFAMESLSRDSTTSSTDDNSTSSQKNEKMATKIRRHVIISSIGLIVFNTVLVSVVNGLYIIYSPKVSSSTEVLFQFALALFNVTYSIFIIPAFTVGFAKHSDAINMRIWLLLINSLAIPCIVTAITSPSCIQVNVVCVITSKK
jgi:hypothetical protein